MGIETQVIMHKLMYQIQALYRQGLHLFCSPLQTQGNFARYFCFIHFYQASLRTNLQVTQNDFTFM